MTVMNMRVGKLVAAAVIIGEVILLLCVFGGDDLSEEIYMQEKYYITKYFRPYAKKNWNRFVNHVETEAVNLPADLALAAWRRKK